MIIRLRYSDGRYTYRRMLEAIDEDCFDVPDETVARWDAVFKAEDDVQRELLRLDNERYGKEEGTVFDDLSDEDIERANRKAQ